MAVTLVLEDEDAMVLFHLLYNVMSQIPTQRNAAGQLRVCEDYWPEGLDVPADIPATVSSVLQTQKVLGSLLYPEDNPA